MDILDYGRSYICYPGPGNAARFVVESRTRVVDAIAGAAEDYYQCASCKSENTFGEKDLFPADNYDFLPIIGPRSVLIFRRKASLTATYRSTYARIDGWGDPILRLVRAKNTRALSTFEQVRDATRDAVPLVARTEIADTRTGLKAVAEYPVKTMNISLERRKYQVDTGPIAFPDFGLHPGEWGFTDYLCLAFVAFNTPAFADFVIEAPATLAGGSVVHHYSRIVSLAAVNTLYAAEVAS